MNQAYAGGGGKLLVRGVASICGQGGICPKDLKIKDIHSLDWLEE